MFANMGFRAATIGLIGLGAALIGPARGVSAKAVVVVCAGLCWTSPSAVLASDLDGTPISSVEQIISALRNPQGEVTGDEWGWDLRQYVNIVKAFVIDGRLLVLTARDTDHQLLIEPMTGRLLTLDAAQAHRFAALADRFSQPVSFDRFLDSSTSIVREGSIGSGTFSCTLNFNSVFRATNVNSAKQETFYIVIRNEKPQRVPNRSCSGSQPVVPHSFTARLSGANEVNFLPGPDGSIWLLLVGPGFIVRLDRDFRLHHPLHDSVVAVRSEAVEMSFDPPAENTLASRERAMEKAVALLE